MPVLPVLSCWPSPSVSRPCHHAHSTRHIQITALASVWFTRVSICAPGWSGLSAVFLPRQPPECWDVSHGSSDPGHPSHLAGNTNHSRIQMPQSVCILRSRLRSRSPWWLPFLRSPAVGRAMHPSFPKACLLCPPCIWEREMPTLPSAL